jgi:PAS domain S-box-containing protein
MLPQTLRVVVVGGDEQNYQSIKSAIADFQNGDVKEVIVSWAKCYRDGIKDLRKDGDPHIFLIEFSDENEEAIAFISNLRDQDCTEPVIVLVNRFDFEGRKTARRLNIDVLIKSAVPSEAIIEQILDNLARHATMNAMRRSESRMRGIFNYSSVGIVLVDYERKIMQANPAFCKISGYDSEQLCAMDLADDFFHRPSAKKLKTRFEKLIGDRIPVFKHESRLMQKKGAWLWVDLTLSQFSETDGDSQLAICLVQDIDEKMAMRRALEESEHQLRDLSSELINVLEKERRRFSIDLHDSISGNLASIKFMAEQLLLTADDPSEEFRQLVARMERQVVETMEELNVIAADLYPPMLEELGLLAAVRWLGRKTDGVYPDIETRIVSEIEEDAIPPELKLPMFRLVQEAVTNAAKHSGGSRVTVEIKAHDGRLRLVVMDNGKGFPSKPFRDVDDAKGMGLRNMVKRAELSGGHLTIAPKKGRGTTVRAEWDI